MKDEVEEKCDFENSGDWINAADFLKTLLQIRSILLSISQSLDMFGNYLLFILFSLIILIFLIL